MLVLGQHKKRRPVLRWLLPSFAVIFLLGGLYILSLTVAPSVAPLIVTKPITVEDLPAPQKTDNRIIIPKLGVDIAYGKGSAALDRGAEWRNPTAGNPETGGNFVIAAHRFSIQPTPMGTVEKSPFYNIDKLVVGDKIIIDYLGTRYGYEINKIFTVTPSQVEIESASETPKLTVYSCELGGSEAGRVVLTATPLGKVALTESQTAD